ncbi:MAG: hypothetical protein ACREAK_01565 [Nitrosarchaeum sp.]
MVYITKPVLILLASFLILQSFTQASFSNPPGPTITYKGLENGCKIFEITDKDRVINLQDGKISKVVVSGTNITPSSAMPAVGPQSVVGTTTTFVYPDPGADKVKIKVCGLTGENLSDFKLTAFDKDGVMSNNVLVVNLLVQFHPIIEPSFTATLPFKKTTFCDSAKDLVPIELVELTLTSVNPIKVDKTPNLSGPIFIDRISDEPLDCSAIIKSTLQPTTPAVLGIAGDPEGDFFLSVLEICIVDSENNVSCPDNYSTSILLSPPPLPIGGKIIPIETTALLLAGAQTSAVWMAPLLAGAAGVATILIKKKRN